MQSSKHREFSEDLNSIKKSSQMWIKKNLQGKNGRVDEAKNQINDLEHKEAKNKQLEQQEKKEYKKTRMV